MGYVTTLAIIIVSLVLIKRFFRAKNLQFRGEMMLFHALTFAISSVVFLWQEVALLKSIAFFKNDIVENASERLDSEYRIQLIAILISIANTLNRALIYYVYWNLANMCYIIDALQRPSLESKMQSENQLVNSASSWALNEEEGENVREFVPKEYQMTFLSAQDRVQKEQVESSLVAANFQNLILEMFA